MPKKKITIAGAGRVGGTVAQLIAYKELGDIVLWNRTEETAKGIALDIAARRTFVYKRRHCKELNSEFGQIFSECYFYCCYKSY